KPNIPAPAGTVYAAAGTAQTQFSPTRMTVHLVPTANVYTAAHRYSYHLDSDNDGGFGSWVEIDPTLDLTVPGSSATAIVTANMDLWTTRAGYNQDLGLFVSDNGGPDQPPASKASGGAAAPSWPDATSFHRAPS